MNVETMREKQLNVRLSPEEWERCERVAHHYGLNPPNLVRMLIKREDDRLRSAMPPATTSTRASARKGGRR